MNRQIKGKQLQSYEQSYIHPPADRRVGDEDCPIATRSTDIGWPVGTGEGCFVGVVGIDDGIGVGMAC